MIVVTGATGNVGRPLVRALAAAGEQVTAVSRGEPAPGTPAGVRHLRADLTEPTGLKSAFDQADALFQLTSGALLSVGGGDLDALLDTARSGSVRRVVLLSSHGVATGRHPSFIEDAVTRSGLEWTMLRPGAFASNAFWWAHSVREERVVAAPFGDVAVPVVDPADIADVAAVALRESGHDGARYELTGPAPISPRQQAAAIGTALGEPVRFVEQTRAEARTQLVRSMPEPVAEATLDALGAPTAAEQRVSPDTERLLGRPPRTFAAWAARTIEAFR